METPPSPEQTNPSTTNAPEAILAPKFPRAKVIGVPEDSNVVTLWKAPKKSNTNAASEVTDGWDKTQFKTDGLYFATDKQLATEAFQEYGTYSNGLQEINIPRSKFDELVYKGVIKIDGYYEHGRSWHVPPAGIPEFNEAIKLGPANRYHPQ